MYHLLFEHRLHSFEHLAIVNTLKTLAMMCEWEIFDRQVLLNDGWWLNTLIHTRVKVLLLIGLHMRLWLFHYLRMVHHIYFTFLVEDLLFDFYHLISSLISTLEWGQVSVSEFYELVAFNYMGLFWVEHGLHSWGHGQALQRSVSNLVLYLHFLELLRLIPALIETVKVSNIFGFISMNTWGFVSFRDKWIIFF